MFQLILPEVGESYGPLYLLIVMTILAPVLAWASAFLSFGKKDTGGETYKPT